MFLAEYGVDGKPVDAALLRFFKAATYFRLACRYRFKPHGEALALALLDLAVSETEYSMGKVAVR